MARHDEGEYSGLLNDVFGGKEEPDKQREIPSSYEELIGQATTEHYAPASGPQFPWEDVATGLASAAGYRLGQKAQQNLVLPQKVRNTAISLQNAEQKMEGIKGEHAANLKRLEDAQVYHDYLHSDQALIDRLPEEMRPAAAEQAAKLTYTEGPKGVAAYQEKFVPKGFQPSYGPTEGLSMQDVQRRLIPQAEAAGMRGLELEPGARRVAEAADLYLTPEGQQAKIDALLRQQEEEKARLAEIEKAKQRIHSELEPHRRNAIKELTAAQEAASKSETALRGAQIDQSSAAGKMSGYLSELSPGMQRVASAVQADEKLLPAVLKGGSRLLSKIAMPLTAASVPYEAKQAYEAYQKQQYEEMLKHGLGAGSGMLTLAAPLALALGAAPATAAGLEAAGVVGGLGALASDIPDIYSGAKEKIEDYWKNR